ncbi:hypothetical protein [Thalassospira xiamenensis]|uniref:Uncharacterized protein n=1 Tax=Thalassospira xiamenensis TaxID=220697 RepID=A0A285TTE7_9PROT|nr:hypothetical protein [Thalassospira xiamenensis]SOC27319.1 hypothetical protein SAMN05428964_105377 [Thalassospira xiamenensis]
MTTLEFTVAVEAAALAHKRSSHRVELLAASLAVAKEQDAAAKQALDEALESAVAVTGLTKRKLAAMFEDRLNILVENGLVDLSEAAPEVAETEVSHAPKVRRARKSKSTATDPKPEEPAPAETAETKVEEPAPAEAAETKVEEPAPAETAETKVEEPAPAETAETKVEEPAPAEAAETKVEEPAPAETAETKVEEPAPAETAETKVEEPAPAEAAETKVEEPAPVVASKPARPSFLTGGSSFGVPGFAKN